MTKCFFDKPYKDVFTSRETYQCIAFEVATAAAIQTLAASLLGKNKPQAALAGASSSLLYNTIHFTAHRFEKNSPGHYLVYGILISGIITAAARSYHNKTPYLSWSNLSLSIAPILTLIAREKLM